MRLSTVLVVATLLIAGGCAKNTSRFFNEHGRLSMIRTVNGSLVKRETADAMLDDLLDNGDDDDSGVESEDEAEELPPKAPAEHSHEKMLEQYDSDVEPDQELNERPPEVPEESREAPIERSREEPEKQSQDNERVDLLKGIADGPVDELTDLPESPEEDKNQPVDSNAVDLFEGFIVVTTNEPIDELNEPSKRSEEEVNPELTEGSGEAPQELPTEQSNETSVQVTDHGQAEESDKGSGEFDTVTASYTDQATPSTELDETTGIPITMEDDKHGKISESPITMPPDLITQSTTTEIAQPNGKTNRYVKVRVCTKEYVCKANVRGPCSADEVLRIDASSHQPSDLSCSTLECYPWKDCVRGSSFGSLLNIIPAGRCVPKPDPCFGLPSHYRYDELSKRCYSSFTRQPPHMCGPEQTFMGIPFLFGRCECTNRRLLPYIGDNFCYRPFTQGPCLYGDWLAPIGNRRMECQPSLCPDRADGSHYYWPGWTYGPPGCYQANTAGPCPSGSVFILDDYLTGKAYCSNPLDRLANL